MSHKLPAPSLIWSRPRFENIPSQRLLAGDKNCEFETPPFKITTNIQLATTKSCRGYIASFHLLYPTPCLLLFLSALPALINPSLDLPIPNNLHTFLVDNPLAHNLMPLHRRPHLGPQGPIHRAQQQHRDTHDREDIVRVTVGVPVAIRRDERHDDEEQVAE